ncbi:MAG: hypothetical protein ABI445_15300 [Polyangia bacterium]
MRLLLSVLFLLPFAGCAGNGLGIPTGHKKGGPDGGTDGGQDGGTGCAAHTDQASCDADASCVGSSCFGACNQSTFLGCFDKDNAPPVPECPPSGPCEADCSTLTSEELCDGRTDCFTVFGSSPTPMATCDCSGPDCCTSFSHCSAGPAVCSFDGRPDCSLVPAYCLDGYIAVVENGCTSGCVRESTCTFPD